MLDKKRNRNRIRVSFMAVFLLGIATSTSVADQVSYTYDALGRLKTVSYTDGTVVEYHYDPAGNRTSQIVSANGQGSGQGGTIDPAVLVPIIHLILN